MHAQHRQHAQYPDQQIPLRHPHQRIHHARRRLIQALKGRQTPDPVINPARTPPHIGHPIHPPGPLHVPGQVVLLRPFPLQHRVRLPIALLLPPIRLHRVPPMMPHHRRRTEPQRPAPLLQPPTHIHIASSQLLRKAMLHPGMCSASKSDNNTCVAPPGECATHSAIGPSFPGAMFGPPTAARPTFCVLRKLAAKYCNHSRSGYASSSIYDTISPLAAFHPVLRALLNPRFSVRISRHSYPAAMPPVPSVDPSSPTITS